MEIVVIESIQRQMVTVKVSLITVPSERGFSEVLPFILRLVWVDVLSIFLRELVVVIKVITSPGNQFLPVLKEGRARS